MFDAFWILFPIRFMGTYETANVCCVFDPVPNTFHVFICRRPMFVADDFVKLKELFSVTCWEQKLTALRKHGLHQYVKPIVTIGYACWGHLQSPLRRGPLLCSAQAGCRLTAIYIFSGGIMSDGGGGRESEGEGRRERDNKWSIAKCDSSWGGGLSPFILFYVMGLVLQRRNGTEKNTLLSLFIILKVQ